MGKKISPALLFLAALISCGGGKAPYVFTTKTIAIASESKGCKECVENTIECCMLHYGNRHYIRNQTYVLDSSGQALKVYDYTTAPQLGAVSYERNVIPPEYETFYRLKQQRVRWVAAQHLLIDGNDTIRKFEDVPEFKALIADARQYSDEAARNGNVVIYTYR